MSEGWLVMSFAEFATLHRGYDLPIQDRQKGSVPIVGSNGVVGYHYKAKVKGPGVVTGRSGSIGLSYYVENDYWPLNTGLYVVDFHGNNPLYVHFFFQSFNFDKYAAGVSVPTLNRNLVHEVSISVPQVHEQQKIAAILFKIQQAIEIQESIIEKTRELKNSTLHYVFTHGLRGEKLKETEIGPIPESWEVCGLDSVLKLAQYGLSVRGLSNGRYPILRMNCQIDGQVHLNDLQYVNLDNDVFEKFKIDDGDILFNRTNSWELVGRTAIYHSKEAVVFASYLIRLKLAEEKINSDYLNYFFNMEETQNRLKSLASRGVSQSNISASKLKTFQVPVPALDEQLEVVKIFRVIDQKADLHTAKKSALQDLFKTMLNKLMTGEIRVKDLDIDISEVNA
jgi:type I restriction enzyme S subunit